MGNIFLPKHPDKMTLKSPYSEGGFVMDKTQEEKIIQMRNNGQSYAQIEKATGVSVNTIKSFCRRNNLKGNSNLYTVRCKNCSAPIRNQPKVKPKKFCSAQCRVAWWNSHLDEVSKKAVYSFTCKHCGKPFIAYGNNHRKYCSRACYLDDRFGKAGGHDE